ncbi:MAG TPA: LysR family transcriptional regulator [Candidatus Binataceae bacterium]|nr:LysR family transcriptional regulator [Candidatus Binataceae bacterium]
MDRIDAMTAFVASVDEGSLAAASRRLGRSPAAVTRAIAALERRTGTRLLYRTTRTVRLTEAGERYIASCRRILVDLQEAELVAAGERSAPRGVLNVTAPLLFGRLYVRPLLDAYLDIYPAVQARLLLLDRVVNLIDEGMDAGVRIAHLPDSGLIAVKAGEVRRVTCASPAYLGRRNPLREPSDLASHECISFSGAFPADVWTFAGGKSVRVRPRLTVTEAEAAVSSAVEGRGVTCVLSYQAEQELARGRLKLILEQFEPPPLPVHVIYPEARLSAAKTRVFVDFVVPRLKKELARIGTQVAGVGKRRAG